MSEYKISSKLDSVKLYEQGDYILTFDIKAVTDVSVDISVRTSFLNLDELVIIVDLDNNTDRVSYSKTKIINIDSFNRAIVGRYIHDTIDSFMFDEFKFTTKELSISDDVMNFIIAVGSLEQFRIETR